MQTKKEEVRQKILQAAKAEFLEKDFATASIRSITARAGMTLGNFYVYFQNKEAVFEALVQEAVILMEQHVSVGHYQELSDQQLVANLIDFPQVLVKFREFIEYIEEYREALTLLFFKSSGSAYRKFRDNCIENYYLSWIDYVKTFEERNLGIRHQFSELFLHNMSKFYLSVIEEMIEHQPDKALREQYIWEVGSFVFHGAKELFLSEQSEEQLERLTQIAKQGEAQENNPIKTNHSDYDKTKN